MLQKQPAGRFLLIVVIVGVGKGIALGIVGVLLFDVAVVDNAARSAGLDAALHTLTRQPLGPLLLILVALGFAAHGVFCFCESKYREV